jgi:peptidoglycan-associated lipoprotein
LQKLSGQFADLTLLCKAASRLTNLRLTKALIDPGQDPTNSGRDGSYGEAGMNVVSIVRGAKFVVAILATLAIAGCAKQQADQNAMGAAATPGSQQDFVVNVGDRVFFDTDSSELSEQARATLDKQAQWLNNYNRYAFTIEGHADERGTREYNIALGARRAETVRQYLNSRGIQAQRMHTISYGKERPVAVCNDISCWSQNRRAVTVLDQSS